MRLLSFVIEDGEDLCRAFVRVDAVRGHGRELDGLARPHQDRPRSEPQSDGPAEHREPLVPRMHLWLVALTVFREAHLADRHATSITFAREQPEGRTIDRLGFGTNHDVLVALRFDELVERGAEGFRDRDELFERDPLLPGLDTAERRGREE